MLGTSTTIGIVTAALAAADWSGFAISKDARSLDPEEPMNARLRNNGAGLTPRVASVDAAHGKATVGGGAIGSLIDVPLGWHVIDDGRRVLIFEPTGKVQINLNLIPRQGRSSVRMIEEIQAGARQSYPNPEFARRSSGGSAEGVMIRRIADGATPIEQLHLLRDADANYVLRARITATPDTMAKAAALGELILASARGMVQDRPSNPGR